MKARTSTQYEFLNEIIKTISSQQYVAQSWDRIGKQLGNLFLDFSSETEENVHCLEHLEYGTSSNSKTAMNRAGFKIKGKDILISDIMNALEDLDTPPDAVKEYFPELTIEEWSAATRMMTVLLLEKEVK
jgi:hypothetical protein